MLFSASTNKMEVQWSPVHYNKFITWGTEINLYETLPIGESNNSSHIKLSDTLNAHVLATNSYHHYIKCVDMYPKVEKDTLLAVGQANGKITLSTFGPSIFDSLGLSGVEFVPKHARQCNTVCWNHFDCNLIAGGLERYRTDHSVLIWDVHSSTSTVAELGLSDAAYSLAWLQARALVIGMNNKHLKMVDLRDPSKALSSSQTKAVNGLILSPHNNCQIASFVDTQIVIWDTRSLDKPALTLPQRKPVTKILWCPTRHNLLGSLQKDSKSIHLHDILLSSDDVMDPSVLERSIKHNSVGQIASFSWHPKHENRLIILGISGNLVDYSVFERMTLNWSQMSQIIWSHGRNTLKFICDIDEDSTIIQDLSREIKWRALQDYGLKTDLKANAELVKDEAMKKLWVWLHKTKSLIENGVIDSPPAAFGLSYPGIRNVLGLDYYPIDTLSQRSELIYTPWVAHTGNSTVKVYRSEIRDKALLLCDWKFVHDATTYHQLIEQLESEGCITRAAAVSVFSLRLRQAIKILSTNSSYNTVAMALSGYTDDKNSMWRESCLLSRYSLTDPYLRAIFAFLTSETESYELVLNETKMSVADRVGFALTFLSDTYLVDYLGQLTESLIVEGNLSGIIVTGTGNASLSIFQQYIDITGDVQSVSLIAMRCYTPFYLELKRVQYWINSYRELLDSWRMWNQRAQFDIWLNGRLGGKPEPQIYVSCNYCGKNTSNLFSARNKTSYSRIGTSSNPSKLTCCPNCRKPQPRCAICLVNMGTGSCYQPESPGTPTTQINPFNSWFTWCQTCRHGGHALHITQWFQSHQECPVTGCSCKCFSLDAASNITSLSSLSLT